MASYTEVKDTFSMFLKGYIDLLRDFPNVTSCDEKLLITIKQDWFTSETRNKSNEKTAFP